MTALVDETKASRWSCVLAHTTGLLSQPAASRSTHHSRRKATHAAAESFCRGSRKPSPYSPGLRSARAPIRTERPCSRHKKKGWACVSRAWGSHLRDRFFFKALPVEQCVLLGAGLYWTRGRKRSLSRAPQQGRRRPSTTRPALRLPRIRQSRPSAVSVYRAGDVEDSSRVLYRQSTRCSPVAT